MNVNAVTSTLNAEIVIVGAGVIGSALASALGDSGARDVIVIDPDLEGTLSSSELNAGGVRATFNQPINVLCSKITIEYLEKHARETGYRPVGYLWMHRSEGMKRAVSSIPKWKAAGWEVQEWSVEKLRSHAPFIDQTDDLAGAVFGPRDGLVNPNLLRNHFRNQAQRKGVVFLDRLRLESAEISASGVKLFCDRVKPLMNEEEKTDLFSADNRTDIPAGLFQSGQVEIRTKKVVNCAGAWAAQVARALGYSSEAKCVRRQVSLFDCREVDMTQYGMMIDPSGVYFHPEAAQIMSGIAVRDEPPGANFTYEGLSFFEERIWAPLAERSSKFQALKHVRGWAGLYEISPDESAIIGEVNWDRPKGTGRVFESHSYSGHGVMHSYSCGVALAEKILHGRYETLDLALLSGDRFQRGKLVPETAVI